MNTNVAANDTGIEQPLNQVQLDTQHTFTFVSAPAELKSPTSEPSSSQRSSSNSWKAHGGATMNIIPFPPIVPEEPSPFLRLATELRQQILKQLLWTQLYSNLKLWAAAVEQHTGASSPTAARTAPRSSQAQSQMQPFLQTLQALAATCTMLRSDLNAALPPLTANMLGRWSASVRRGHRGLYEHMGNLVADGWLDTRHEDEDEDEDEDEHEDEDEGDARPPPIRTMEDALERQPVAANALYQQMASRLLYEEPSQPLYADTAAARAGTRAKPRSILAILAEGMYGVLRFEWMLSGGSISAFLDDYDNIFGRRWTLRQVHRELVLNGQLETN